MHANAYRLNASRADVLDALASCADDVIACLTLLDGNVFAPVVAEGIRSCATDKAEHAEWIARNFTSTH